MRTAGMVGRDNDSLAGVRPTPFPTSPHQVVDHSRCDILLSGVEMDGCLRDVRVR